MSARWSRTKRYLRMIRRIFSDFINDDCIRLASALAYYTAFSLPPLLLIVISIASRYFNFNAEDVRVAVLDQINYYFGPESTEQIERMIEAVSGDGEVGYYSGLMGVVYLLVGATAVVSELQSALNKIWHVEPDPLQGGLKNFIFKRLISFAMVMGVSFLLMVSLVISALLAALGEHLRAWLNPGISAAILESAHTAVSFVITVVLFAAMYRYLPDARIRWRDVWLGAAVTALLFNIGKLGLGYYLARSNIGSLYGAAGSLAIILLWLYYAGMVFYLGAEFTQVWNEFHGHRPAPEPGAARSVDEHHIEHSVPVDATEEEIQAAEEEEDRQARQEIEEEDRAAALEEERAERARAAERRKEAERTTNEQADEPDDPLERDS